MTQEGVSLHQNHVPGPHKLHEESHEGLTLFLLLPI